MPSYLFTLGRMPQISLTEIQAVFDAGRQSYRVEFQDEHAAIIATDNAIDSKQMMGRLGGTVSIAEEIAVTEHADDAIVSFLLSHHKNGKIVFSVTDKKNPKRGIGIKKQLKNQGYSARFVEKKNTATVLHNDLVDLQSDMVLTHGRLFVTRAIQDIEGFGSRDYGRPAFDDKSGMLPPKLARIMINLSGVNPAGVTLLDPFCGSGTILMEAAVLGCSHIIGSDVSQRAVADSQKNMDWMRAKHAIAPITCEIIQADIRDLANRATPLTADVVITEPYLGKPLHGNERRETLLLDASELKTLYVGSFRALYKLTKPGSVILFIIPRFFYKEEIITINLIDEVKKIGFTPEPFGDDMFLLYKRDTQHVGREIWRFKRV